MPAYDASTPSPQVYTFVSPEIKARLVALKNIDKAVYSETRVIRRLIEMGLHVIEKEAHSAPSFLAPIQRAPGTRKRLKLSRA